MREHKVSWGGYEQTTENAKSEASLNLRFAESGTKKEKRGEKKGGRREWIMEGNKDEGRAVSKNGGKEGRKKWGDVGKKGKKDGRIDAMKERRVGRWIDERNKNGYHETTLKR